MKGQAVATKSDAGPRPDKAPKPATGGRAIHNVRLGSYSIVADPLLRMLACGGTVETRDNGDGTYTHTFRPV